MVLGDRCEMFVRKKAKLVAAAQKDLIKSPLFYIIICITFLYSCPKIAWYNNDGVHFKNNTERELLKKYTGKK